MPSPWKPWTQFFEKRPSSLVRPRKIHDYTSSFWVSPFIFETANEGQDGYLTSSGKLPAPGDIIILPDGENQVSYQVQAVERYSDPRDLWTAWLHPVPPPTPK